MFNVNINVVKDMNDKERRYCELTYLDLAYSYESEIENRATGSYAMMRDPAVILCGMSRGERKLMSSFKDLFDLSKTVRERTGKTLVEFVTKEEKTPENALNAWFQLYFEINRK